MKIEIGNNTTTIPLEKLDYGSLFAAPKYVCENGVETEEVLAYMYMLTYGKDEPNAVVLYPEEMQGSQEHFDSKAGVIPLYGTLKLENLPLLDDFEA